MNGIKKNIPNAVTSLNLLFGCISIIYALHNQLVDASWMIVYAAIADFFDGMAARLLKVSSPIGKELDSLADVVSFGVAPGMIIYQLINTSPYSWIGLLVPIFAAIRLAKFNIDTRQTFYFIGLPTPANALFIASFPLIIEHDHHWHSVYYSNISVAVWFFVCVAIACSAVMVSSIKLFSLKLKDTSWANNRTRYGFLLVSLACLLLLGYAAVPIIMVLYIIFSLFSKKSFDMPAAV
jgi:CDP-diacylglycerol--serine O-phosphatidyltransferase